MLNEIQNRQAIATAVTLTGDDLRTLAQLLRQILIDDDSVNENIPKLSSTKPATLSHDRLSTLARDILRFRRRRADLFNRSMFGEPAWDMLLTLYTSSIEGPRHSVGQLGSLSGSPQTTALRWLEYLVMEKLVVRLPNPTDRRSDFVELSDKGRAAMEKYLSETLEIRE
jgi:DNA-binding MarR family transcriptional regulator